MSSVPQVSNDFSLSLDRNAVGLLPVEEHLISADSHVMEPPDFWQKSLPLEFRDRAPRFPPETAFTNPGIRGGFDPNARLLEMKTDGVIAEVLYPTLGLMLFRVEDPALQEACFRAYNDWLAQYCSVAPGRLVGVPMISTYNIPSAVRELERCRSLGLRGALVWQVPHPSLPFRSKHYDPLWAAAQDLEMPVSLHIVSGFGWNIDELHGLDRYHGAVNRKLMEAMDALFNLIFSGVLERYPRLKFVVVENEIGWMPFVVDQWDKSFRRWGASQPLTIDKLPSEYVSRQVYATFFFDQVGGRNLAWWGVDSCMWSNDFPHPNTTWPNSRQVIARDLGHLSKDHLVQLIRGNVTRLYGLDVPVQEPGHAATA